MNKDWDVTASRVEDCPHLTLLAALDSTLEATALALATYHEELQEPERGYHFIETHIAESVMTLCHGLRALLDSYNHALQQRRYRRSRDRKVHRDLPF